MRRAKSAAPTRSSPAGVSPGPSPSSGNAASWTEPRSPPSSAHANACTRAAARSSGNGGSAPASITAKPLGRERRGSLRASSAHPERSAAATLAPAGNGGGCHGRSALASSRSPGAMRAACWSTIARGCIAMSPWPIQTTWPFARAYGAAFSPGAESRRPPLATSASCAAWPIARTVSDRIREGLSCRPRRAARRRCDRAT